MSNQSAAKKPSSQTAPVHIFEDFPTIDLTDDDDLLAPKPEPKSPIFQPTQVSQPPDEVKKVESIVGSPIAVNRSPLNRVTPQKQNPAIVGTVPQITKSPNSVVVGNEGREMKPDPILKPEAKKNPFVDFDDNIDQKAKIEGPLKRENGLKKEDGVNPNRTPTKSGFEPPRTDKVNNQSSQTKPMVNSQSVPNQNVPVTTPLQNTETPKRDDGIVQPKVQSVTAPVVNKPVISGSTPVTKEPNMQIPRRPVGQPLVSPLENKPTPPIPPPQMHPFPLPTPQQPLPTPQVPLLFTLLTPSQTQPQLTPSQTQQTPGTQPPQQPTQNSTQPPQNSQPSSQNPDPSVGQKRQSQFENPAPKRVVLATRSELKKHEGRLVLAGEYDGTDSYQGIEISIWDDGADGIVVLRAYNKNKNCWERIKYPKEVERIKWFLLSRVMLIQPETDDIIKVRAYLETNPIEFPPLVPNSTVKAEKKVPKNKKELVYCADENLREVADKAATTVIEHFDNEKTYYIDVLGMIIDEIHRKTISTDEKMVEIRKWIEKFKGLTKNPKK